MKDDYVWLSDKFDTSGWVVEEDLSKGSYKMTDPVGHEYYVNSSTGDSFTTPYGDPYAPYSWPNTNVPVVPDVHINTGITKEQLETCAACGSDCEWVLCDVCKLALVQLRDKVLLAIAKTIEDDLS